MHFKFWNKGRFWSQRKERHLRPKELSDLVGIHMVTKLNLDPDWVWSLRAVERPHEDHLYVYDFRIFDPQVARSKQVEVANYATLDNYPEMVVFSGTIDKAGNTVQFIAPAQAA